MFFETSSTSTLWSPSSTYSFFGLRSRETHLNLHSYSMKTTIAIEAAIAQSTHNRTYGLLAILAPMCSKLSSLNPQLKSKEKSSKPLTTNNTARKPPWLCFVVGLPGRPPPPPGHPPRPRLVGAVGSMGCCASYSWIPSLKGW